MTSTTLRSILERAEIEIDTYRNPDVGEARKRLNEILVAAGLGSIGSDEITSLGIDEESVYVRTYYSAKGCDCGDRFEFPVALIDAPDPVRAAARWGLEKRHAEIFGKLNEAKRLQAHLGTALAEIEAKLAAA